MASIPIIPDIGLADVVNHNLHTVDNISTKHSGVYQPSVTGVPSTRPVKKTLPVLAMGHIGGMAFEMVWDLKSMNTPKLLLYRHARAFFVR